jgi:hypothetical protein
MKSSIFTLTFLFLSIFNLNAQTVFWTEGFGTAACVNQNQLATAAPSINGPWTQSILAVEGASPNQFFVSSTETFTGTGNCGDGCLGNPALNNQTLHVGSLGVGLCPSGDCGAAYNAGATGETHKRVESPVINCSSQTSTITLEFDYMHFGENTLGLDVGSVHYFDGAAWSALIAQMPQTTCCGGPCGSLLAQGQWAPAKFSVSLPATAIGNANVRIGFGWDNDANNTGSDPSFAVDNITLSTVCANPDVPTITAAPSTICPSANSTLTWAGNLNAATNWHIYTASCGGTQIGTSTVNSFVVNPSITTTYYIRGEDGAGCVDESTGLCGTVTVTIQDITNPTITCPGNQVGSVDASCNFSLPDYTGLATAADNCTASPTVTQVPAAGTIVGTGTTNVVLTATDGSSNTSNCNFDVVVSDNTNPTITCPANMTVCAGDVVTFNVPTGADNCSVTVAQTDATGLASGMVFPVGTTTIEYTATDGVGNTAICTFDVNVTAIDITVANTAPLLTANQTGATYQWLNCDNGNAIIPLEINQSYTATSIGNYAVEITIGSCVDTSVCVNVITTSLIESNAVDQVDVYPNPTDGSFIVSLVEINDNTRVVVYSVVGKEVINEQITTLKTMINLETYDKGIYFVKIKNGENVITRKIVKQ